MNGYSREIVLPSGRHAVVRRGKGKDLIRAHRVVGGNPEPMAVSFALVAELTQIDGNPVVYEDVLGMELDDVLFLQAECLGSGDSTGNFPMPPTTDPIAVDV